MVKLNKIAKKKRFAKQFKKLKFLKNCGDLYK